MPVDRLMKRDRPLGKRPTMSYIKELEKENQRLRKAVSDLTLDKQILKEAVEGKL